MKRIVVLILTVLMLLGVATCALADDYPYYSKIFVTKNPAKMSYALGESFDPAGIEISGTVVKDASGTTGTNLLGISTLEWSPKKFDTSGSQKVTLSLSVKGKTGAYEKLTCSLTVDVKMLSAAPPGKGAGAELSKNYPYYTGIEVSKKPTKTEYKVGESFDPAGMEIKGTVVKNVFGDTEKNTIGTKMEYSPSKFTTSGSQKVTVSTSLKAKGGEYKTFTTTVTVNVKATSKPVVTKHPGDETVKEKGSCSFIARADGTETYSWHFVSPKGKEYSVSETKKTFTALKVSGSSTEKIKLSSIPVKMDGWKIYCTFTNSAGSTKSDKAILHVTGDEPVVVVTVTPAPVAVTPIVAVVTATPVTTLEPTPIPTSEPHVHSVDKTVWKSDATGHWHECECGETEDFAIHDIDWVTSKKATKNVPGVEIGKCAVCGYFGEREVQYEGTDPLLIAFIVLVVLLIAALVIIGILLKKNERRRRKKHHTGE